MPVMGIRPLYICYSFSMGIDFRRQNLTSNVGQRAERVNELHLRNMRRSRWATECLFVIWHNGQQIYPSKTHHDAGIPTTTPPYNM